MTSELNKVRGVFGAGGCGRGILPLVREQEDHDVSFVFVDDDELDTQVNGHDVISLSRFVGLAKTDKAICIAIANPVVRRIIANRCKDAGLSFFSVAAASHISMDDIQVGVGALISPFSIFTSNIRIGLHFHCNINSYVEHDCTIGDFVTFAPAVRCNGNVCIEDGAYIGCGAIIRQGLTIGAGATIGMGAIVTKDVPAGETWVGNPARPMEQSR